jgi:hypothetical protein
MLKIILYPLPPSRPSNTRPASTHVDVYEFPQDAIRQAVPYGTYDIIHNRGYVYVGASA